MRTKTSLIARTAGLLLVPAFVIASPGLAMANTTPGNDGSSFSDTQSSTGRTGATSDRTFSCADSNGDVSFNREAAKADENGTSKHAVHCSTGGSGCGSN